MDNNKQRLLLKRIRPKIPRRWAPGVGIVGAWVGQKAESPRRARAVRVPRHVLPQGAKTRVRVFAEIQNIALCVHSVHGIPTGPFGEPPQRNLLNANCIRQRGRKEGNHIKEQ